MIRRLEESKPRAGGSGSSGASIHGNTAPFSTFLSDSAGQMVGFRLMRLPKQNPASDAYRTPKSPEDPAAAAPLHAANALRQATERPVWIVPEHALLCPIGEGSYGEVWLARNAIGLLRAVKIVHRDRFDDDRPYEREFEGIRRYEPVSRSHEGLVDILQLGRNDLLRYFYYVMELADDAGAQCDGPQSKVGPASATSEVLVVLPPPPGYRPRSLREARGRKSPLPLVDCARIGATLAGALAQLHRHGLVHRDVKPSNVIFVGGVPKLADIGLVTGVNEARSFVGTEGFIPPEGPGTPQADLYSLGKLLYEISTGKDRHDFPQLPADVQTSSERQRFAEWNEIMLRACATDPRDRYRSAEEMYLELQLLIGGQSLRQRRTWHRRWRRLIEVGLVILAAGILTLSVTLNHVGLAAAILAVTVGAAGYFKYQRSEIAPGPPASDAPRKAAFRAPAIAVLPLRVHGPSIGDVHLGEEMAVEFASKLARIPGLRVLPRQSAQTLHSAPDPMATARSIGIHALLGGAVRRSTDGLHTSLELIDTGDGFLRWSQSYDVNAGDVFALQTDCVLQVAEALQVPLPETVREQVAHSATRDLCAYDFYLLGRRYLNNRTPQDFHKAVDLFEKAVRADPGYALAYTGLAEAYQYLGYGFGCEPARELAPKARAAALKAVELGPQLAEAHTALAIVRSLLDWDWEEAEKEYRQALAINPRCPTTHHFYGFFLAAIRTRFDAALIEARHALCLDPLSLPLNNFVGVMLFFAGRANECIQHQQHWLATVPKPSGAEHELSFAQKILGRAQEILGRHAQAVECYLRELALHRVPGPVIEQQRMAFNQGGWTGFWRVRIDALQALWAQDGQPWFIPYEIALAYARLGETDRVFEWLNRLYDARCSILVWLKIEPLLNSVRNDPRYRELLGRLRLDRT